MTSAARPARPPGATRRNPVLCAGAGVRLMWAFGALVVLWTTIFWALD